MIVSAIMVHIEDGWYGQNARYYYAGPEGTGFKNKTEARKSIGKLKKYVKSKIKHNTRSSLNGPGGVGILDEMKTYIYGGIGPSWACTNIKVTIEDLSEE